MNRQLRGLLPCALLAVSLAGATIANAAGGTGTATLPAAPPDSAGASDPRSMECEYGVTLALEGRDAAAESVFISLLTHTPRDARALNNLGNIQLLRGNPDVAVSFYARAAESDTADGGIRLNEATALMALGNDERAEALAREGIRLAGGAAKAARLLGLPGGDLGQEDSKGAGHTYLSRDEVVHLLEAAAHRVPADSSRAGGAAAKAAEGSAKRRPRTWRSAGARGAEGTEIAAVVYWKQ